ncbi:pro-adrenomedullin [Brachyhypopomus gauderio]|uniref:pro-adrenomedullin n=1 Tax=Brachyhypopomus gauderio TaxID=698409 RepID=UPI0040427462
MKLFLHDVLLWSLLATLVPCAICAPLDLTSEESISVENPCVPKESWRDSAEFLPQSNETEVLSAHHSAQLSERVKRGCNLITCLVHDLAHRINQTPKGMNSAPPEKISPQGYGRRRRRSLSQLPAPQGHGGGRLRQLWLHAQRRSWPQTQT